MSVARGFGINGKSYYSNITKPIDVNLNFIVDADNSNGLGVRSLKSNGYVRNVFMHTSATPGSNNGALNPNPAAGYALIQLNNNFNKYIGLMSSCISPNSGSGVTSVTSGNAYVITSLGTATLAQWQAKGLPSGISPALGVSFIASATGTIGGSAQVQVPSSSGSYVVEVVGDPNQSINNSNIAANGGAYLLVQFLKPSFTAGAYTPAGTINAQAFTGDALASHDHDLKVIGGQAPSTSNDIANYAGPILGKEEAGDVTYPGADAATNGGVIGASAGTPSGTVEQAVFTGTAASLSGTLALAPAAPSEESVITLSIRFDGSSVTVDGL